jgi:transcriptional regulator with XRE-family HTH domain
MSPHDAGSQLRRVRLESDLGLRDVAEKLNVSPQAIHQLEKSEAAGTISLRQLEHVARAMGHRLIYALEPEAPAVAHTAGSPESPATTATPPAEPAPTATEPVKFLDNWMEGRID